MKVCMYRYIYICIHTYRDPGLGLGVKGLWFRVQSFGFRAEASIYRDMQGLIGTYRGIQAYTV